MPADQDTSTAPTGKPGRPARTTREAIAEAALRIGLDRVTVQKIGAELGLDHSSLYRHVKGRDDILLAAADLAIDRLDWKIASEDWRAAAIHAAEAVWTLYVEHPGLAETIRALDVTPPAGIAAFGDLVGRLAQLGFAPGDAALLVDSIMDMTGDSVASWHRLQRTDSKGRAPVTKMTDSWRQHVEAHPEHTIPTGDFMQVLTGDPHLWWRRKLDLLLDGAEVMRARQAAPDA